MELAEKMDRSNFLGLTNTWVLCAILLVFASVYGFSFERGSLNSFSGVDSHSLVASDPSISTTVFVQSTLVYLLSLACILPFIKPISRQLRLNALILSVAGWATLSAVWSENPSTSVINSLRMAVNLILVLYLFERYSANDIQKLVMLVGCVAAAGSIIMVIAFPKYGLQVRNLDAFGAWEGIFGQKNLCGVEMLVMLLPAFFVKLNGAYARTLRTGYIAIVLGIIVMTRSAGACVDTAFCLAFVALLKLTTRMPRKDAAIVALAAAGTAVTLGLIVLANYDAIMYAVGKDPTMTGRTVLWAGLIQLALHRPILGYGYMAFWQGLSGPTRYLALQMNWLGLAGAENGPLEVLLELGFVGLLLYAAVFLRSVKDALYCIGRGASPAALWYISILFFVVSTNIEGGSLLLPSNLVCILPFVAFVGLRREVQLLRKRQTA